MIPYTQLTLNEAVARVMEQLNYVRTPYGWDFEIIASFVNRSIQELLTTTLPYKDWAWINTFAVSGGAGLNINQSANVITMLNAGTLLPVNFIKEKRVLITSEEVPVEARYASPKEFFDMSDWYNKQNVHIHANLNNPVYTIWGAQASPVGGITTQLNVQSALRMYIAPFNNTVFNDQVGTIPATDEYLNRAYYTGNNLTGLCEAYLFPNDVTNPASQLPVPPEFDEAVINGALLRAIVRFGVTDVQYHYQKYQEDVKKLKELYAGADTMEQQQLQSFIDETELGGTDE